MQAAPVALLCRTSDRGPEGARGAAELGELLGARMVGSSGGFREGSWQEDLRDSRGCLLEAGGQVDDALVAGRRPLLIAGDCSVALTTLAAVRRHHADARVVWIDAHGDFNTPVTSPSGFLGGMCLAGACGVWDTGLSQDAMDPAHVATWGVRDLDGGERVLLETHGVGRLDDPGRLNGQPVFLHLDLDVLDPRVMWARFPAPDGPGWEELGYQLAAIAAECDVVGVEVTSVAPGTGVQVAGVLDPLL